MAELHGAAYADHAAFHRLMDAAELALKAEGSPQSQALLLAERRAYHLWSKEGRPERSRGYLWKVILLDEAFGSASNHALDKLGQLYLDAHDLGTARGMLALASRVKPDPVLKSFGYSKELAFRLLKEGELNVVASYLRMAYATETVENADTVLGLALCCFLSGERDEAVRWFSKLAGFSAKPQKGVAERLLRLMKASAQEDSK